MTKITFIRHSKTIVDPNISALNWVLSDDGVKLVKELSGKEEIKGLDIIYSSNQNKALETGVILAKPYNIPIRMEKDLTEVTCVTNAFIKGPDKFKQTIHDYLTGKIETFNNGETVKEALTRFENCLEMIIRENKDKENIGIVAHGNILSLFASQYCDKSAYEIHSMIGLPDLAILDWDNKKFIQEFSGQRELSSNDKAGKFMVAMGGVIEHIPSGKILLIKRSNNGDYFAGEWEDVSGRMDQLEEPEDATKREIKEETGLDVEIVKPLNLFHIFRGEEKAENELVGVMHWCRTNDDKVVLSDEHDEYKWMEPEKALDFISHDGIKEDIRRFILEKNNEKN